MTRDSLLPVVRVACGVPGPSGRGSLLDGSLSTSGFVVREPALTLG
jgi:hypothetical protein